MRRRDFIALVGGAVAAWPLAASAQQATRVYRPGFLTPTAGPTAEHMALHAGLADLGYREGQSLLIERRYSAGNDRLSTMAAELVRANVDGIVTESTPAAVAAMTSTVPIVMPTAGDRVATGLAASLARPGGNVTGNRVITSDIASKKVQLVHELKPDARRLGHVGDKDVVPDQIAFREVQSATERLGMEATFFNVPFFHADVPDTFERAFAAMVATKVDVAFVAEFTTYLEDRDQIVALAARYRLPAVYGRRAFAEAGGLLSYGTNFTEKFRAAASFVDKILKGTNPADLSIEQPTKLDLVINLKTAKALGLTVPPGLLISADEVIE